MRIHTDGLFEAAIYLAAHEAGVVVEYLGRHGSQSHARAFEVALSGSSPYNGGSGAKVGYDYKAATWDEWGLFLVALFRKEPSVVAGSYKGLDDFIEQTSERVENERTWERNSGTKSRCKITGPWLNDAVVRELAGV